MMTMVVVVVVVVAAAVATMIRTTVFNYSNTTLSGDVRLLKL
jgi:hypothetical protein